MTGGGETTGLRIDFEDDHRATVLIGGQEVGSRWIDAEIARGLAPGGLVAGGGQQSRDGVDREDRDAVVPAVGAIEKLAGGVDLHLRRHVGLLEPGRQGGDRLQGLQGPGPRVVTEGRDR